MSTNEAFEEWGADWVPVVLVLFMVTLYVASNPVLVDLFRESDIFARKFESIGATMLVVIINGLIIEFVRHNYPQMTPLALTRLFAISVCVLLLSEIFRPVNDFEIFNAIISYAGILTVFGNHQVGLKFLVGFSSVLLLFVYHFLREQWPPRPRRI